MAVDLVVDVFLDVAGTQQPGLADLVAVDVHAQARLAAPDLEVSRAILFGDGGAIRGEGQAHDKVAVALVGEVGPAELHRIERANSAQLLGVGAPDAVGIAFEVVQRAGRLARVVFVVAHAEGARQVHVGAVVLNAEAQVTVIVDVPLPAQAVVLDIRVGVFPTGFTVDAVEVQLQAEIVGQVTAGAHVGVP